MADESSQKPSLFKQQPLAVIALILATIAIICAALAWQQYSAIRDDMGDRTRELQQSFLQLKTVVQQYQLQSQATTTENEKNIAAIMNQLNDTKLQPILIEVGYLVRLAHLHVIIENNVAQAIQLLRMAEKRLQALASSSIDPLKQALNQDITALSAIPQINTNDLINQIDQLDVQIATIEIQTPTITRAPDATPPTLSSNSWWDKIKHNIGGLKDLFIVRRIEEPVLAPLTPPQFALLKENIRLKLSQAQWALLSLQKTVYQQSLYTAARWLSQINQNQPSTNEVIKKLEALAVIDIKPQVPSLQSLPLSQKIESAPP